MSVTTYGELKEWVRLNLYNRRDLGAAIPNFIAQGERRIFRRLRIPATERILNVVPDSSLVPDGMGGLELAPTELITVLPLPGDFLELKMLTFGGRPLDRISDIQVRERLHDKPAPGQTSQFGRDGDALHFFPPTDSPEEIRMTYWADYSGQFEADSDTNPFLLLAPDVYLYSAMIEGVLYLDKPEALQIWEAKFEEAMSYLEQQYHEAEYAGSVVEVQSVYADTPRY